MTLTCIIIYNLHTSPYLLNTYVDIPGYLEKQCKDRLKVGKFKIICMILKFSTLDILVAKIKDHSF